MAEFVVVSGVRFEVIGPVDRRRSVNFTTRGLALCPYCADGGRKVGTYSNLARGTGSTVRHWFLEHLRRDHFRCTARGCGWIGTTPKGHVTRSPNHDGPLLYAKKLARPPRRVSDLLR